MILKCCLALVFVFAFGQTEAKLTSDFSKLQEVSLEELKLKTDAHRGVLGLDKMIRWDLSQETGDLIFTLPDGLKAVSPAQIIGSYNSEDHTWLWAWANPSIDDKLKIDAIKLREYGEEHHVDRLTTRKWIGTEADAWAMVAVAVKLFGKQGAYRGPAGKTYFFIAFGDVVLSKK